MERTYGVKLVRGPFLKLSGHPDACETEHELLEVAERLRGRQPAVQLAADLFCGAGGLSLGLHEAGYEVILAVDNDPEAAETHRHHFPGLTVDWDLSQGNNVERVASLMAKAGIDLLAGGPPCQPFSKAGRSKVRHLVHSGSRDPHAERRDLWRAFLEIARLARPRAVLMENVPDMALDKDMFILRSMVEDLEAIGYAVEDKVIDAFRYGVPQFRQRLILVAMRDGVGFNWPPESPDRVTVWNAIGDMPDVEGGWRPQGGADGWIEYTGPISSFQRRMRSKVQRADARKLFDHITRPVRDDDLVAFNLMDSSTKYSDLPDSVKRYRDDIFDDKYKRLPENDLSRTVTAHIARDGYWYIHPRQPRTLTVREAARLQTFPDPYRFAGPPSAAFRQIGNAVPPVLAEHLGRAVHAAISEGKSAGFSTQYVAELLANWFASRTALSVPWLRAATRWQLVAAEILLDRADQANIKMIWPIIQQWKTPDSAASQRDALTAMGRLIGREHRVDALLDMAVWLTEHRGALDVEDLDYRTIPKLTESIADLAVLAVPVTADQDDADEPVLVTRGVLRTASRFIGEPVDRRNKLTDGRMAVARMIGGGTSARHAHLGLIELSATLCRPARPICTDCPLAEMCVESQADHQRAEALF